MMDNSNLKYKKRRNLPLFITGTPKEKQEYMKQNTNRSNRKQEKETKKTNFSPTLTHHPKLYTCPRLKEHCHIRGLSVSGLKNDLIDRIVRYEEKNNFINWPAEGKRRKKKTEYIRRSLKIS